MTYYTSWMSMGSWRFDCRLTCLILITMTMVKNNCPISQLDPGGSYCTHWGVANWKMFAIKEITICAKYRVLLVMSRLVYFANILICITVIETGTYYDWVLVCEKLCRFASCIRNQCHSDGASRKLGVPTQPSFTVPWIPEINLRKCVFSFAISEYVENQFIYALLQIR